MPSYRTLLRKAPIGSKSHPLEGVVLRSYEGRQCHDRLTLAVALAGASGVSRGGTAAYVKVAEDVLGCMESQGKLVVDWMGWHRLPDDPEAYWRPAGRRAGGG